MRPVATVACPFALVLTILLSLAGLLASGGPALAELRSPEAQTDRFSALEQSIIREYYGTAARPAGQVDFAKRTVVPPGTPKRSLPRDLAAKLPPVPTGRRRVIVGGSVLLLDSKTNTVLDVLPGVAAAVPIR